MSDGSNVNASQENQLQDRVSRIVEGVLMLGGELIGLWLLNVLLYSFLK
ncbi:MAG: hypothetical protein OEL85_03540 [Desulfobulbaceae bacterium]|nr:hypothetical protein [Desulfobulbaceae bacterium]